MCPSEGRASDSTLRGTLRIQVYAPKSEIDAPFQDLVGQLFFATRDSPVHPSSDNKVDQLLFVLIGDVVARFQPN